MGYIIKNGYRTYQIGRHWLQRRTLKHVSSFTARRPVHSYSENYNIKYPAVYIATHRTISSEQEIRKLVFIESWWGFWNTRQI